LRHLSLPWVFRAFFHGPDFSVGGLYFIRKIDFIALYGELQKRCWIERGGGRKGQGQKGRGQNGRCQKGAGSNGSVVKKCRVSRVGQSRTSLSRIFLVYKQITTLIQQSVLYQTLWRNLINQLWNKNKKTRKNLFSRTLSQF
jgi:hypothetical protein